MSTGELPLTETDAVLDRAVLLLLRDGAPLPPGELSGLVPDGELPGVLGGHERRGRIRRDADGNVVGAAGVSVVPADYRIDVGGLSRWCWCAKTGLGVLGALGAGGRLTGRPPDDDEPLHIDFEGGDPVGDVVVLWPTVEYESACSSAAGELCLTYSLFADAHRARTWAAARGVGAEVLGLPEALQRSVPRYRTILAAPADRERVLAGGAPVDRPATPDPAGGTAAGPARRR